MTPSFEKYKGIHPGVILERELKKRNIKKRPFALSLKEYPQIINDVSKGKRGLTPSLSIKIDKALDLEEGTMLVLQAYYEIKKERLVKDDKPDLKVLRKALFWDTDIKQIDWKAQYRAVIKRVFERGNNEEKAELERFYGLTKVKKVLADTELNIDQSSSSAIF
ncbi:plasmid maintenance system antidote protein [Pedobacter petrophilus]|uniref:Plasmid maintenance system antidote protein n=1 Tax=Pedobacter petrophilus TaxID=1908241 RepID=A0A7K0G179_9SPHI|nr:plasmid maintenance system antidote protein [Pedobacter petrophilus]MRX77362.1 plasmid maintenance system antidote protein [Pedobacter petrophilus]